MTSGLSPRAWIAALAAVFALQAALWWIDHVPASRGLVGDEILYLETARAIERGEGAAIEPMRPPLYAYLLAGLGVTEERRRPIEILQLVLLVGAALLLRALTRELLDSPRAGDLAALGMLLCPTLTAFSHYLWPEVLHLTLWIAVLWILASRRHGLGWLVLAGVLTGTAILTRHLLLAFLPFVAATLWLDGRTGRWERTARFLIPVALIVTPALLLDWSEDGRLRSASSARFNLWVGLNDQSRKSLEDPIVFDEYRAYLASADDPAERDEILRWKTRKLVEREGIATLLAAQLGRQYFRLFDKETFFTEQLPGGLLHSDQRGYRISAGATATALRWLDYALYALILAAAAWGIAASSPGRSPWLRLILIFLAYNLAIFLVLHVKSRYRLQLMPFLILLGAHGIDRLLGGGLELPLRRRWIALGVAVSTLFLAFAGTMP